MIITSSGVVNGVIDNKYGKHGNQFDNYNMPTFSLPFKIEAAPKETVSFAFVLEDKDAYPVTGFVWVHWVGANLKKMEVLENESINTKDFVQGVNSWISVNGSIVDSSFYGGMAPPDKDHVYELHVYALDTQLDLNNGFYLNELYKLMDGHILDSATLKGVYSK